MSIFGIGNEIHKDYQNHMIAQENDKSARALGLSSYQELENDENLVNSLGAKEYSKTSNNDLCFLNKTIEKYGNERFSFGSSDDKYTREIKNRANMLCDSAKELQNAVRNSVPYSGGSLVVSNNICVNYN